MHAATHAIVPGDKFVRAVMHEIGAAGPTDLARKAAFDPYVDFKRKIGMWLRGRYQPNYEATMKMLRAAGWLNEEKLAAAVEAIESARRVRSESAIRAVPRR